MGGPYAETALQGADFVVELHPGLVEQLPRHNSAKLNR